MDVVNSNLKILADKRGVSVRHIAKELPYRFETVRQMYNNETKHYPKELLALLCKYFDCQISDLLVYEKNDSKNTDKE